MEISKKMHSVATVRHALVAAAVVVAASAGPVLADEMWETNWGTMEYAEDIGVTAVLSYQNGALFIDGLAGNYSNRGSFSGLWIEYGDTGVECDVPATDDYGNQSWAWGYIDVFFIDPAYPSRWTADYTVCDGPVAGTISGTPL